MTKHKTINPAGLARIPGLSHAVVAEGRLLFVSGQVPLDAEGKVVSDDFEAQVEKVFENLGAVLADGGASFAHVVKLGYFVVELDAHKLGIVRKVRGRFISGDDPPASSLIGVAALFRPDVYIEIEAVAQLPARIETIGDRPARSSDD